MRYSSLFLAVSICVACTASPRPETGSAAEAAESERTSPVAAVAPLSPLSDTAPVEDFRDQCDHGGTEACLRLCQQEAQPCEKGGSGKDCRALLQKIQRRGDGEIGLGVLHAMPTSRLAPTQGAVGGVAAQCRATGLTKRFEEYDEDEKWKFQRYLIRRPVPTVVGPEGRPFITDRHHLSTGLLRSEIPLVRKQLYVCAMARWTDRPNFWREMERNNFAWLHDRRGNPLLPERMPANLAELPDDPYRTLSRWVRNSCGYVKCDTECGGDGGQNTMELEQCKECEVSPFYLEFRWGDYLRGAVPIDGVYDLACNQSGPNCKTQSDELRKHLQHAVDEAGKSEAAEAALPGWNFSLIESKLVQFDAEGCDL